MFVVFDLDGTLANCDHRIHHIRMPETVGAEYPKQDWRAFYAACKDDAPIEHLICVAQVLVAAGHRVEIWTGRSDECRDDTVEWLIRHGLGRMEKTSLIMREAGDHTADHKLKRKWLADRGKPDLIFEDRASVVQMWRDQGIVCCQVAPGDF